MITEVNIMTSFVVMLREGYLEHLFNMFEYLNIKLNSRMVFDPKYPDIDVSRFKKCDWKHFYTTAKEAIPDNAPEPCGKDIDIRVVVGSDYTGDSVTRISSTSFFISMNIDLVRWYSKKQSTIESSIFGPELFSIKVVMETVKGLIYKLYMMEIPFDRPIFMYCDNMSVIHNTQRPASTLKKKLNSLCYHMVRESAAMGGLLTGHITSTENYKDLGMKVIVSVQKRNHLISMLLYDIPD